MKKVTLTALFILSITFSIVGQDIIELKPSQSMCIAGKGSGQDGAINPYLDVDSIGIVENIGKNSFTIRIQKKEKITELVAIKPKETKEIKLPQGYVMYFDTEMETKAKVSFKKVE